MLTDKDNKRSRELVQIPRFVIDKAIEALRLNYNNINCECCLKRMTASAHNLLKVHSTEGATEADIQDAITSYSRGNLM